MRILWEECCYIITVERRRIATFLFYHPMQPSIPCKIFSSGKRDRAWKYAELTLIQENKYWKLATNVMYQHNVPTKDVQSGPSPICLNSKQQPSKWKVWEKQSIRRQATILELSNKENVTNWEHLLLQPFEKERRVVWAPIRLPPHHSSHTKLSDYRWLSVGDDESVEPAKVNNIPLTNPFRTAADRLSCGMSVGKRRK